MRQSEQAWGLLAEGSAPAFASWNDSTAFPLRPPPSSRTHTPIYSLCFAFGMPGAVPSNGETVRWTASESLFPSALAHLSPHRRFSVFALHPYDPVVIGCLNRRVYQVDRSLGTTTTLFDFESEITSVASGPTLLAFGLSTGRILVFDMATKYQLYSHCPRKAAEATPVEHICIPPISGDERVFFCRRDSKDVFLASSIRRPQAPQRILECKKPPMLLLCHSHATLLLVIQSGDSTIRIFDYARNEMIVSGFKDKHMDVLSACWLAPSTQTPALVVSTTDSSLVILDEKCTPLGTIKCNHPASSLAASMSTLHVFGISRDGHLIDICLAPNPQRIVSVQSVMESKVDDTRPRASQIRVHPRLQFGVSDAGDLFELTADQKLVFAMPAVARIQSDFSNCPTNVFYVFRGTLWKYDVTKGTSVQICSDPVNFGRCGTIRVSFDEKWVVLDDGNSAVVSVDRRSVLSTPSELDLVGSIWQPQIQSDPSILPLLDGIQLVETSTHLYGIDPQSGTRFSICSLDLPQTRVCSVLSDRVLLVSLISGVLRFWYKSCGTLELLVRASRWKTGPGLLIDQYDALRISEQFPFDLVDRSPADANLAWNMESLVHQESWVRRFKMALRAGFFDSALQVLEAEYLSSEECDDPLGTKVHRQSEFYRLYRSLGKTAMQHENFRIAQRCFARIGLDAASAIIDDDREVLARLNSGGAAGAGQEVAATALEIKLRRSTKVDSRAKSDGSQIFDEVMAVGYYMFRLPYGEEGSGGRDGMSGGGVDGGFNDGAMLAGGGMGAVGDMGGDFAAGGAVAAVGGVGAVDATVEEESEAQKKAREAWKTETHDSDSDDDGKERKKKFVVKIKAGGARTTGSSDDVVDAGGAAVGAAKPRASLLMRPGAARLSAPPGGFSNGVVSTDSGSSLSSGSGGALADGSAPSSSDELSSSSPHTPSTSASVAGASVPPPPRSNLLRAPGSSSSFNAAPDVSFGLAAAQSSQLSAPDDSFASRRRTQSMMAAPADFSFSATPVASGSVDDSASTLPSSSSSSLSAGAPDQNQSMGPHAGNVTGTGPKTAADLLKDALNMMETNKFSESMQLCEEALRLMTTNISAAAATTEKKNIVTACTYKLTCKVLIRVLQQGQPLSERDRALLSLFLTTLPLLPKHKFLCTKLAISHQMALGNFSTSSQLINDILADMPPKPRMFLNQKLQECQAAGGQDTSPLLPLSELHNVAVCWKTLRTDAPVVASCSFCPARYLDAPTGSSPGDTRCVYCHVGTVVSSSSV